MRVLGIVPARGGSKRVPRKNVRPLGGKPLVLWAIEAALAAKQLARVVLSSDDDEVLALGARHADVLCLRRPDDISTDTAPAIDYVRHAERELALRGEAPFEAVAIVQPSSPFTEPTDVDTGVTLLEQSGADSAVSVMQLDHAIHPLKLKRLEGDKLLPFLEEERGRMSDHQLPKLFVRNGSVYVSAAATIARGEIIGDDSRGFVMPRERSIDINDELDFSFAEFLLRQR